MQRFSLACSALVVALGTFASGARADGLGRVVVTGSGPTCQMAVHCAHSSDCHVAGETCQPVPLSGGATDTFCARDLTSEVFCCTPASGAIDCPGGSSCAPIAGAGTSGILGICADSRDYCVPPTSLSDVDLPRIVSCFTPPPMVCVSPVPPRGAAPVRYADGDCDADGISNGDEPGAVCDFDAPTCRLDGGAPDAGFNLDAGTDTPDLGAAPQDAGDVPVDAESTESDAGTPVPEVSFRGAGGCACSAGGGVSGGSSVLLLALVGLVARRRR